MGGVSGGVAVETGAAAPPPLASVSATPISVGTPAGAGGSTSLVPQCWQKAKAAGVWPPQTTQLRRGAGPALAGERLPSTAASGEGSAFFRDGAAPARGGVTTSGTG